MGLQLSGRYLSPVPVLASRPIMPVRPRFGASRPHPPDSPDPMAAFRSPRLAEAVSRCLKAFESADSIVIWTHKAPDDDAIGSVIAMREFLKQLYPDKRIDAVVPEGMTKRFRRVWSGGDAGLHEGVVSSRQLPMRYDLAVALDCARLDRLPDEGVESFKAAGITINMDHHENDQFADINVVDPDAPSTTALLYREFISARPDVRLNRPLLESVMAGIMGDTMDLTLSSSPQAPAIVADLEARGAETIQAFLKRKEQLPLEVVQLFARAVGTYARQVGDVAYVLMPRSLIRSFDGIRHQPDDVREAFFRAMYTLRDLEGVRFYFGLLEQPDGKTLLSLRSKAPEIISAADVARAFNRGGGSSTQAAADLPGQDAGVLARHVLRVIQQVRKPSPGEPKQEGRWERLKSAIRQGRRRWFG